MTIWGSHHFEEEATHVTVEASNAGFESERDRWARLTHNTKTKSSRTYRAACLILSSFQLGFKVALSSFFGLSYYKSPDRTMEV